MGRYCKLILIFILIGQAWADGIASGYRANDDNDVLIALRVAKEMNLTPYQTRLLLAIRASENGREGREYGVLSVPASTQEEQAKVTARSIRNNWKQWEEAGKPEDFISFMATRWCPIGCDNDNGTNKYWSYNIRYFLKILEGERHKVYPIK